MGETITKVINNAWVISIVTGVLVYFATNWYSKFKDNKEYRKNIDQVTDDIVVMLQEFIVENKLPEKAVLFSYYIATCGKYNVLTKDTKSIIEILDFLTKEILDSQFLNSKNKLEYCSIIEMYKFDIKNETVEEVSESEENTNKRKEEDKRYNKIRKQYTLFLALASSVITLLGIIYNADDLTINMEPASEPVLTAIMAITTAVITMNIWELFFIKRKQKK